MAGGRASIGRSGGRGAPRERTKRRSRSVAVRRGRARVVRTTCWNSSCRGAGHSMRTRKRKEAASTVDFGGQDSDGREGAWCAVAGGAEVRVSAAECASQEGRGGRAGPCLVEDAVSDDDVVRGDGGADLGGRHLLPLRGTCEVARCRGEGDSVCACSCDLVRALICSHVCARVCRICCKGRSGV